VTKNAIAALGILGLLAPMAAAGDVLVIGSDRDNTLYENKTGSLSNGAGIHFFAGLTALGQIRRGVVRFDLSAVPPGATIESVVLTLNMSRTEAGPRAVALHRATADWGEGASDAPGEEGGGAASQAGDSTWIHTFFATDFWSTTGGDFASPASSSIVVGDEGLYSWGTTAGMEGDVAAWVNDPAANFGWVLVGEESLALAGQGISTAKRFDSREIEPGGVGPRLEITFTPSVPVELQRFELIGE
jgi:hypothetical protein